MKRHLLIICLFLTGAIHAQTIIFSGDSIFSNKSNLSISVALKQPLIDYLKELAPTDSLWKTGNYQFSFYVDNHLIYHTELWPGFPDPNDQKWTKPLIDYQHEGAYWSQFAWYRFMNNGGEKALSEGPHTLKIELRPYVKAPDLKIGEIIAEGKFALNVKRIAVKPLPLAKVHPYKDLPVSKEKFDTNKIKLLKGAIEAGVFRHITSVVAIKNNKILFEEYFDGNTRDSLHDVRSVGKTFAAALTGLAIRDGYLKSENQTLGEFYSLPNEKAKITLKELLTMSSPFDGDDSDDNSPGNEENMYPTENWLQFTLNLPVDTIKYHGQWHYFTAGVMLLGSTLDKIIPGGLEKYADKVLFAPLHITNYKWQYTPQHAPSTAGGIRMNSLDFAKFGLVYANKKIIPASWVEKSLSHQLPITGRENEFYGYLFWNKKYGKYETYYCSGNGGNKIYIFNDMVIVITATAYNMPYAHGQVDKMMEEFILPAIY
ncbi:serine hydrolase [[Flexibacter] sp. ATCC 35208]|uniref:serine hydrolase domain-containing protein n=1 Tax=[Flexibacter] sp. ATCC 35208 TaxID=1936242 RepID=UPI0009FA9589|nr:serine hydrolase [[Flexibacter] sp. ATCC 35208]